MLNEHNKILIASTSGIYGGGETYLLQLDKVIRNLGFDVEYIVSNATLFNKLETEKKELVLSKNQHISAIKFIALINNKLKKTDYKYIILNGLSELGVFAKFIKHKKIISIAHSNEEWLDDKFYSRGILHLVKRIVISGFDKYLYRLVVLNNKTLSHTKGYGMLENKSVKVYTGIEKIDVEKSKMGEGIIFGRIGRLVDKKGNSNLINAFSQVLKKYPMTKLLFAGDGYNRDKLENKSKELGIQESIVFLGEVNPKDFYSKIDCMVSPSLTEAFPMIILEAMSAKIPIISTAVGGVMEILEDDRSAKLIRPNNIIDLENAMLHYIDNTKLYDSFVINAYNDYCEKFSQKSFTKYWAELLV